MKVWLAGERTFTRGYSEHALDLLRKTMKRRLFSYYYHGFKDGNVMTEEILITQEAGIDLFLDSGAFSAFTQGIEIDIEMYAEYVKEYGHHYDFRANLDVIGDDGEGSWTNLKKLEELGADVNPVYHYSDDIKYLPMILDGGYDYMALGGMVGASTQRLQVWLDYVWSNYLTNPDGTAKIKVHGFGITDQKLMFRYPWYSVDSSSWLMTGIFGSCMFRTKDNTLRKVVFSDESPEAKNYKGWHYRNLSPAQQSEIDRWLIPFEVTAEECASHYSFRDVVNSGTFQGLEDLGVDKFIAKQETLF